MQAVLYLAIRFINLKFHIMSQHRDCSTALDFLYVTFGSLEFSEFCFVQHESRNGEFFIQIHSPRYCV